MWEAIIKLTGKLKKQRHILVVISLILLFGIVEKKGYINILSILNSFNKDSHDTYIVIPMSTPSKPEKSSAREKPAEIKKPSVKAHQDSRQKETFEIAAKVEAEAVQDKNNQLIWQKTIQSNFLTWSEAQEYCKSLDLGGYADWRLPTKAELESLVDTRYSPPINPLFGSLPDKDAPYFWSGTLFNETEVYLVSFKDGRPHHSKKEKEDGFVRCVRRG